jgi:hypothetical protein
MAFVASGYVADNIFYNSFRAPLLRTDTYQVAVTLTGQDTTTDGYSSTVSTSPSGNIVLTGSQNVINVYLSNASWPSNFSNAAFVCVWLKTNSGGFQLAECVAVDAINDMVVTVKAKPMAQYTQIPIATLQASSSNSSYPELGDRNPQGFQFVTQSPTTETVNVIFNPSGKVTFSPNNAADFDAISSRSAEVQYQVLANDVLTFCRASFGDYTQVTANGHVYQQADLAANTAQIVVQGNRPFIVTPPPDPATGVSEQVLFTSLFLKNLDSITQAWSKKAQTPTPYHFVTVPSDYLFNNSATVFTYSRK